MREITLPAYPILTFDPMMSLWSASDKLYESDVRMWTKHDKPIRGYIIIDGNVYRFMGAGNEEIIPQTKVEMGLTSTKYTFEGIVRLEVTFTNPFILSDLKLTSRPVGYVTVNVVNTDDKKHFVDVLFDFSEQLIYRGKKKLTVGGISQLAGGNVGFIGRRNQKPMYDAGDILDTDWGYFFVAGQLKVALCSSRAVQKYLSGRPIKTGKGFCKELIADKSATIDKKGTFSFHFCFAWDDGYSIDYYGVKKKGYWTKYYQDVYAAIREGLKDYDKTMARCLAEDTGAENEIIPNFGLSYYTLLLASFRQVIAAHKLIEADGKPIFISKENSSNGCAATVDVTYPSSPLFLLQNPALLRGMLDPVYAFARKPVWRYDFAPHDAGIFPYVMGQVYAIYGQYRRRSYADKKKLPVFMYDRDDIYNYKRQMPVEESANMIILTAAYYNETGDKKYIMDNFDLLQKWANYLVEKGFDLENQLSTDDFSGWLPKNVNLAIKSTVAIALWAKVLQKLDLGDGKEYRVKAEEMAADLKRASDRGDHYAITLDGDGWSTKYNLVWDKIFSLNLFGEEFYQKELTYYKTKLNTYGLPLDHRNSYSKSDWMMWVTVLDDSDETLRLYADTLVKMLAETTMRIPYPDLFETIEKAMVKGNPMFARTVQGGMWLPLYAIKVAQSDKNYLL